LNDVTRPILASPDFATAYLKGVPDRWRDFEFMLGTWSAQTFAHADDGSETLAYTGTWIVEALFDGRIIFDRFTGFLPDGRAVSNSVTLRTWCEATGRWEMTFLNSGQPNGLESFTGQRVGDEMHLEATGLDLLGRQVEAKVRFFDIRDEAFVWDQRSRLVGSERWYLDRSIRAQRVA
jgi:hypothetical protein